MEPKLKSHDKVLLGRQKLWKTYVNQKMVVLLVWHVRLMILMSFSINEML